MAHIDPVHRHVDDGAHMVAGILKGNTELVHELLIARQDGLSVHHRLDSVAGDLLGVGDPGRVGGGLAGRLDGPGDGMVAEPLRQGGQFQQLPLAHLLGVYGGHLEGAPGEGTRLVKDHNAGLRQSLQVVAALHQNALLAGPADAPEEGQRMEMTRAQGQETTRKFRARCTHMSQGPIPSRGGSTARARAAKTTAGV